MVCDVVIFVLRHFLGFMAGFYLFTLIVIRLDKIRGLEWLKMRFCYSGIRIIMLLRYNKRGFVLLYARVRRCVRVYMYTL